MELMRWNPSNDLFNIHRRFDSLWSNFFAPARPLAGEDGLWNWNPAVDVFENDDDLEKPQVSYVVTTSSTLSYTRHTALPTLWHNTHSTVFCMYDRS